VYRLNIVPLASVGQIDLTMNNGKEEEKVWKL
jgi:hypothetical protein